MAGTRGKLNLQTITDGSNRFQVNDIVLAMFGKAWYEAKILECYRDLDNDAEPCYFIHYSGWNKKTDELVSEDRLQKKSDENASMALSVKELKCLKKKRKSRNMSESTAGNFPTVSGSEAGESATEGDLDLVKLEIGDSQSPQIGIEPASPNIAWSPENGEGNVIVTVGNNFSIDSSQLPASVKERKRSRSVASSKARSVQSVVIEEPAEIPEVKPEISMIHMSEKLKEFLYRSCKNVVGKPASELPAVPHTPNVVTVFMHYLCWMSNARNAHEFISGLRSSFNFYLEHKLLYESERQQLQKYQQRMTEAGAEQELPEMASLYGVSHLLRFFTVLEPILAAEFPAECIPIFVQRINKFLEFIDANLHQFCPTVETANIADTTSPAGNTAA